MANVSYLKFRKRAPAKRAKFGNKKIELDGIKFDSLAEANRYCALKLRVRIGEIRDLELQPRFDIIVNGVKVAYYKADFRYRVAATGEVVVEDVKSPITAEDATFRLKKKLVEALHQIKVRILLNR